MYYRLIYVLALPLYILLTVTSCTSCGDSRRKPGTINPLVQQLDETPDTAELVILNSITNDSIYVLSHTRRRNEAFAYNEAQANGMVYGTLKEGDKYSIYAQGRTKTVKIAINVTELEGRWIYNQAEFRGIDFNNRGGMSSINTGDICFREWKLLNGRLYIYYVDAQTVADNRHKYEVEEAYIQLFNHDHLVLLFKGQTYDCQKYIKRKL